MKRAVMVLFLSVMVSLVFGVGPVLAEDNNTAAGAPVLMVMDEDNNTAAGAPVRMVMDEDNHTVSATPALMILAQADDAAADEEYVPEEAEEMAEPIIEEEEENIPEPEPEPAYEEEEEGEAREE